MPPNDSDDVLSVDFTSGLSGYFPKPKNKPHSSQFIPFISGSGPSGGGGWPTFSPMLVWAINFQFLLLCLYWLLSKIKLPPKPGKGNGGANGGGPGVQVVNPTDAARKAEEGKYRKQTIPVPVGADNSVHAGQAAWWYSWRMPPSRSLSLDVEVLEYSWVWDGLRFCALWCCGM
ncbi:hypothetical protein KIPE111705_32755 [Kibdelosporangium persicum]|uniref:hypothetical protein n=1 Tax=Kibdelosporangium persicum TaxID=2698649 RepID=UPI001FE7F55C|nr:hypothetical protein [Kibdelosporangium persicum]